MGIFKEKYAEKSSKMSKAKIHKKVSFNDTHRAFSLNIFVVSLRKEKLKWYH